VLDEIGAGASPRVLVFNKTDLIDHTPRLAAAYDSVCVSARTGRGLGLLPQAVARFFSGMRHEVRVTLPTSRSDLVAMARRDGRVLSEEYEDDRVTVCALVTAQMAGRLRKAAAIG
jgi:GTP-binding protein HflX